MCPVGARGAPPSASGHPHHQVAAHRAHVLGASTRSRLDRRLPVHSSSTAHCFADLGGQLDASIRLGKEEDPEILKPALRQDLGRIGRHEEDPLIRKLGENLLGQFYPVRPRHHHIDQHQVHRTVHHAQGVERFRRARRLEDAAPLLT